MDSDLELWRRIHQGDTSSFSIIFKKYYLRLYNFAMRFVPDSQAAQNIVQEMFVHLWIQREKHNIQSNLKSYLFTSVRNRALNYINQIKKNDSIELDHISAMQTDNTPEQDYMNHELQLLVHKAIDQLPEKCRQIYLMKRYDELKYAEIAQILDISINTVKTQIKRALVLLQKHLSHLLNPLFI